MSVIKLPKNHKQRYFNEYLFHQVIQQLNESKKQYDEPVILTSKARLLHRQLVHKLEELNQLHGTKENPININTATFVHYATAMNDVLRDVNDGKPVFDGVEANTNGHRFYWQQFLDFCQFTGWYDKEQEKVKQPVLPLSPYDSRFANRAIFRQNGSRLLFARDEDLQQDLNKEQGAPLFSEALTLHTMTGCNKYREVGKALLLDDKSGMSLLMPYISQKDYNAVVNWVNKIGETDDSKYMSKDAIARSCAILKTLQDEGTDYTIECDENIGQIKACITGTKISIRLTDSRENEKFIGRIYDDGRSVYYTTNKKEPNGNKTLAYDNPTPDDCIRLLHFAQGKSIDRNDTNEPSGKVKTYTRGIKARGTSQNILFNEAYHSGKNYSAVVGAYPGDSNSRILIHVDNNRSASAMFFSDKLVAETYLKEAVISARENFMQAIDVDMLVREAIEHADDDDYTPNFSGDGGIAAIQLSYWEVLRGRQSNVLRPGVTLADYKKRMADMTETNLLDSSVSHYLLSDMLYDGTPEEKVRQHLLDNTDYLIGNFEVDEYGQRFDPVNVASYMTSEFGKYRNNDNMIAALRAAEFEIDELKGNDFYNKTIKDKMLKFDITTAKPMARISNPFIQTMFQEIKSTITETGCTVNDKDILIDENGIVHYTADRVTVEKVRADGTFSEKITGEIGQIFIPDELGLVETKFAGTDNYLFTPGYEAYIIPQKEGENKTVEERTRLKGYEQIMRDSIRYQIRSDLFDGGVTVGSTTSVNKAYRRLYDTRYPLDFVTQAHLDGMDDDLLYDIIKTNARRVRYGNELKEGSTINAEYQARVGREFDDDISNDNYRDYYRLTGGRNMSIMTHDGDGYFDPSATGTSTNQGLVRYLVESCHVTPDGEMIRGDLDDKTPLMKNEVCKYMDYIPFDRRQMTFNNLLKASCVANEVYTAQMTFGGLTFDDGYVVSKEFADKYQIRGDNNELRPLKTGDKISDMNGNKGVISLVIDRDMDIQSIAEKVHILEDTLEPTDSQGRNMVGLCEFRGEQFSVELNAMSEDSYEIQMAKQIQQKAFDKQLSTLPVQAAKQIQERLGYGGYETAIQWFKANSKLEVVGAPFPAMSRMNAGSAKELMERPEDLIGPDGTVYEGCMGRTHYIITHMAVDEKTKIYGEDELAQGKGRKASAQLAWALASQDCTNILREFYGSNNGALSNLREMMITMGLDMDEVGNLRTEYQPHVDETRQVFLMPELEYKTVKDRKTGQDVQKVDIQNMKRKFKDVIAQSGGILEVPFQLNYPTGATIPALNDDKTNVVYGDQVNQQTSQSTYGLPVLSSYLRSGQEFENGASTVHDYTNHYIKIYELALNYKESQKNGNAADMERYQRQAQAEYDKITHDLEVRKFSGKHNTFRDNIMANRIPNSATAVWSANPTLDIDQIAMNSEMAEALGVKETEYVMVWRDPVLRDAGVRYLRVKIDDSLTGVAIHPVMDKCFDGDFDGDSIGMGKLQTKAAQREAMEKLTVNANLLDYGIKDPVTGKYELMMQDSLDMKSAAYVNPELVERRRRITDEVNDYESAGLSKKELAHKRANTVKELNQYVKDALQSEYGTDMVSFKDMKSHLKSVEHMIIDGAKGSYSKLQDYTKYLGIEYSRVDASVDVTQPIDLDSIIDNRKPSATREDDMDVQYATAVKAFGTGIAGMFSQRGISALRNQCPKAVLELTYPVTQSILQSKHDPIEARHKYEMLMSTGRELWRGRKLDKVCDKQTGETRWVVAKDKNGKPLQATPDEFKQQFMEIYTSKEGLNVAINEDYVGMVCKGLTGSDGFMMNIEKEGKSEGAILDKLAYGGTFDTLCEAAKEGRNLFEGKYTSYFAPNSIRKNMERVNDGETAKAIVKSDVAAGYQANIKNAKVVAVGGVVSKTRKDIDVSGITDSQSTTDEQFDNN